MKTHIITLEQSKCGTRYSGHFQGQTFLHAMVKACREWRIRAQWKNGHWSFWHAQTLDGKPSFFNLA